MSRPGIGSMDWLNNDNEKIAFFINLRNFLILFGLCKDSKKSLPKTALEWLRYKNDVAINVGDVILSALEIEDGILKAQFNSPDILSAYSGEFPFCIKFEAGDERSMFTVKTKVKEIIFGLYIPTM